ncbi:HAMP domain-containing sensor histidine kinase [Stappia sp. TSB10GB4]|uniref:sensor histidine kinase n=1 Tax=Stappia sp. TSB10GB4 TaxID=2003584 RepID=UPI001AD8F343|nr:HAMP domain-containing sensor histidine kinase [Stappia sp. TSB10GB4]
MSAPHHDETSRRDAATEAAAARPGRRRRSGLSGKLLILTVIFVMISEVLIFVPSIANFRNTWLTDKLTIAGVAASVLVETDTVSPAVQAELLRATGALAVALDEGERRRLIAMVETPGEIGRTVDMGKADAMTSVMESFAILLSSGEGRMRVIGPTQMGIGGRVDIVMPEARLRNAMLAFSVRILALSLVISAITATLVYLSLRWLLVRPIRRLTSSMLEFQAAPDDPGRIIVPSGRQDELGDAERCFAQMQTTLRATLEQRRQLATLGLAVSKINHDLRNLLASAQLFSERLEQVADPTVQRLAPKIIATLDRAVDYTSSVLAYGSAREAPLRRRLVRLDLVVRDVGEVLGLTADGPIAFENRVAEGTEIEADPEQVFRVLMNLCRNAVQALRQGGSDTLVCRIVVEAEQRGADLMVRVRDTGPGVPPALRDKLFRPFQSAAGRGGSGLGLAIAAELVGAHGGEIRLLERMGPGAVFEIRLPRAAPAAGAGMEEGTGEGAGERAGDGTGEGAQEGAQQGAQEGAGGADPRTRAAPAERRG